MWHRFRFRSHAHYKHREQCLLFEGKQLRRQTYLQEIAANRTGHQHGYDNSKKKKKKK